MPLLFRYLSSALYLQTLHLFLHGPTPHLGHSPFSTNIQTDVLKQLLLSHFTAEGQVSPGLESVVIK